MAVLVATTASPEAVVQHRGATGGYDTLCLQIELDAPRGRVVRTSASFPDLKRAAVVVPESAAVIQIIAGAKDALYVQLLDAGIGRIARVDYATGRVSMLRRPVEGTISEMHAAPDESRRVVLAHVMNVVTAAAGPFDRIGCRLSVTVRPLVH